MKKSSIAVHRILKIITTAGQKIFQIVMQYMILTKHTAK